VLLDDGRQLDGIDALVFCTGYQADYSLAGAYDPTREQLPAWTAAAGSNNRRLPRLYRNIFSLELPQCLAFIGCISFLNPAFELYDLASMALAQVWAGKARLPSRADMAASVDAQQAHLICLAEDGIGSVAPCWVDRDEWMAWAEKTAGTGVGAHLGYGYAGWSFWIQDRHLCRILMDGIPSPHVCRHFETGRRRAWQGARDEILRINEKEI
jgi:dimethylaniline monooxygenase (N-oxide forming)